jgi:hypothetical protein
MTKKSPAKAAHPQPPSDPQWVVEMHEHFRRTGYYRTADLRRVLGDPRKSVEVRLNTGLVDAHASKK